MLDNGAGDCKLVKRLLARMRGLRDEVLKDCVYDGSIPRRGTAVFIGSGGLEC